MKNKLIFGLLVLLVIAGCGKPVAEFGEIQYPEEFKLYEEVNLVIPIKFDVDSKKRPYYDLKVESYDCETDVDKTIEFEHQKSSKPVNKTLRFRLKHPGECELIITLNKKDNMFDAESDVVDEQKIKLYVSESVAIPSELDPDLEALYSFEAVRLNFGKFRYCTSNDCFSPFKTDEISIQLRDGYDLIGNKEKVTNNWGALAVWYKPEIFQTNIISENNLFTKKYYFKDVENLVMDVYFDGENLPTITDIPVKLDSSIKFESEYYKKLLEEQQ